MILEPLSVAIWFLKYLLSVPRISDNNSSFPSQSILSGSSMEISFLVIEMTQKEVADSIGISQSYISRLEKRIIKRLKVELEKVL